MYLLIAILNGVFSVYPLFPIWWRYYTSEKNLQVLHIAADFIHPWKPPYFIFLIFKQVLSKSFLKVMSKGR